MNKSLGKVLAFIIAWLFVILLFTFFIQARGFMSTGPIIRKRQEVVEAFQTQEPVEDMVETSTHDMSPADASLSTPREPYSLLGNWLKVHDNTPYTTTIAANDYKAVNNLEMGVGTLPTDPLIKTAAGCHAVDFQTALEKTGNFRQLTNNYKRGDPDSCSAPIQELATTFYQVTPVPRVASPSPEPAPHGGQHPLCPKGDSLLGA